MQAENPVRQMEALLSEFVSYVLGKKPSSPHTVAAYLTDAREFVAFIDAGGWNGTWALSIADFERAQKSLGLAAGTVVRRLSVARRFADLSEVKNLGAADWNFIRKRNSSIRGVPTSAITQLGSWARFPLVLDHFLGGLAQKKSQNTFIAYRRDLARFGRSIGAKQLESISQVDVQKHFDELRAAGLSVASVKRGLAAVHALFEWSRQCGFIVSNPASLVTVEFSEERDRQSTMTPEAVNLMMASKRRTSWFPERDHLIIEFLAVYGMRPSEIAALNCGDLDIEKRVIYIKKSRALEMQESTPELIEAYLRFCDPLAPDGAFILNKYGRRLTTRSIGRIVKSYALALGLPEQTHPMALRKAVVELAAKKGVDTHLVMRRIGSYSARIAYLCQSVNLA